MEKMERLDSAGITLPTEKTTASSIADYHDAADGSFSSASESAAGQDDRSAPSPTTTDPLDSKLLAEYLSKSQHAASNGHRFQFTDITRDMSLGQAARLELDGAQNTYMVETGSGKCVKMQVRVHDAEIARQQDAVATIDKDVAAESKVAKETTDLMLERLQDSNKSLEVMTAMLASLAAAEQVYGSAMSAASSMQVGGTTDGPTIKSVAQGISDMVLVHGEAHSAVARTISGAVAAIRHLHEEVKRTVKEIGSEASRVHQGVATGRKRLRAAFQEHKEICEAMDLLSLEAARGSGSGSGSGSSYKSLEKDPWATEGRLVKEHKALQDWQDKERSFLKTSLARVQDLELQRVNRLREALHNVAASYSTALLPLHQAIVKLQAAVEGISSEAELEELARVAQQASSTAEVLAQAQAESITGVCQELFCSPEIVRQGGMQQWNPAASNWVDCHFVLTRSGFLHWFRSMDDVVPLDVVNLAKCQFEAGTPPLFNIVEVSTKGWIIATTRKFTFQAASVEECCEWAIAVREAIQACRPRR